MLFPGEPGAFSCQTLWLCPSGVRRVGCCLNQLLDLHLSSWNYWHEAQVPNLCPIMSVETEWEGFFGRVSSLLQKCHQQSTVSVWPHPEMSVANIEINFSKHRFLYFNGVNWKWLFALQIAGSISEHHPFSNLNSGFHFWGLESAQICGEPGVDEIVDLGFVWCWLVTCGSVHG